MSKTTTIAKMRPDGSVVEVLADGRERPIPDTPMRPMTPQEVEEAAHADPDARPMTSEEMARARRVPRIKTLRRALGLTQEELETISSWVEGGAPEGDPKYLPPRPKVAAWQDPAAPKGSSELVVADGMPLVWASRLQRTPLPEANWQATVYHGFPRDLHTLREKPGEYLAFLGRISPEKRVDRAVEIARRVGMKLRVAAKVH